MWNTMHGKIWMLFYFKLHSFGKILREKEEGRDVHYLAGGMEEASLPIRNDKTEDCLT